jgi:hypothetical protein
MTTASDMTLFHYVSIWQRIIIALYLFLCMGLFFCRAIYFIQFPYFQYLYFHIELMWMWFSPCVALGQMVFSLWLQNHSFVRTESIGRSGRPNLHSEAFSISAFQCLTFKFSPSEPNPESPLNSFAAALWNNKEGQIHICHLLAILFTFYSCELRF